MADSKTEDKVELQWPVAKATIVGKDGVPQSNVLAAVEDDQTAFQGKGALTPPFDPRALINLYEHSAILRQNIDAYKTNIDGFGHRFDSIIDLEADDATDKIRNAIMFERLAEMEKEVDEEDETTTLDRLASIEVTERDVDLKTLQIEQSVLLEKTKLDCFFDFCCTDESFVSLRRKTREDLEVTGNAYWEVLRNNDGEIVEFVHIPGFSVRLMPKKPELVEVPMKVRGPDMKLVEEVRHKRYRTFVQVLEKRTIYFKEFGDPRVVSSKTGKIYKDARELESAEREHNAEPPRPATEILHFKVHSPRSAYGVPRWVGNLLNVLGARQAEEVNFLYFENKSVPPMAVLVSGGRVSKSTVDRLEDFINSEIKGRRNFHKVMILEAEPADNVAMSQNGSAKIQIVPLTDSQQKDALFQNYDERTMDKVGMAFRLPRMLRGDIRDFNRATADAALEFAEMQVFSPERRDFDFYMNRKILPELGIELVQYVSNGPSTKDPEMLAAIIEKLSKASVLVPAEARQLAEDVFGRPFKNIDEPWTQLPIELTKAGIVAEDVDTTGEDTDGDGVPDKQDNVVDDPEDGETTNKRRKKRKKTRLVTLQAEAKRLAQLHAAYSKAEADLASESICKQIDEMRAAEEEEVEVIKISQDKMDHLLGDD